MGKIYGVAGNPVFHSRSPVMFNAALRTLAIDAVYVRLAPSSAEELMTMTRQIGLEGFNITSPFKTDILTYLDDVDDNARKIGSVNTVVRKDGQYVGYNTDTIGVLEAVKSSGLDPKGLKVVVLGAGGAGRSAAFALVTVGAEVTMVNRTLAKAQEAARTFGCNALPFERIDEALEGARFLISTISTTDRIVKPHQLSKKPLVLDAMYGHATALVRDALSVGCTIIDGREWLLNQAIPAFTLFTGLPAPVELMRKTLVKKKYEGRKNIALIGFMGTGKSLVAEKIASLADMDLINIDKQIEKKAGRSVNEIFVEKGEEEFRRLEQVVMDGLRLVSHMVVSCGGGAVTNRANVRVLRNTCLSAWLWADVNTIIERTKDVATRPLLNVAEPVNRIRSLLAERLFLYASTSDIVISTEKKSPDEIAQRIWDEVHHTINS